MNLTHEQLAVLEALQIRHGRLWKDCLRRTWESGYGSPALQQLRNRLGPEWLIAYRIGDESVAWLVEDAQERMRTKRRATRHRVAIRAAVINRAASAAHIRGSHEL